MASTFRNPGTKGELQYQKMCLENPLGAQLPKTLDELAENSLWAPVRPVRRLGICIFAGYRPGSKTIVSIEVRRDTWMLRLRTQRALYKLNAC